MSTQTITNPTNADHFATLEAVEDTLVVSVGETVLCKTNKAMRVSEQSPRGKYPTVLYFPKGDTSDALVSVKGRSTHCPLKGDASYLSFEGDEVAWIYDRPLPSSALLADFVGFYSDKVKISKA